MARSRTSPLVSNEQYVAGGQDNVRGYLESSQTGDIAVHGTLELRSPNLVKPASEISLLTARAFVDGAHLRLRSPLPGTATTYELISTGVGLTVASKAGFSLRADLAWPLRATMFQSAYRPRLQGSAIYEF